MWGNTAEDSSSPVIIGTKLDAMSEYVQLVLIGANHDVGEGSVRSPTLAASLAQRGPQWGRGARDTRARGLWGCWCRPKCSPGPSSSRHFFQEAFLHWIQALDSE